MRVLALQADHAGCGNARIEVPYNTLRSLGHHVDIADLLREDSVKAYDIVVLQRPGNKWSIPIAEWCLKHRTPLVVELDDLCWALPDWNPFQSAWNSQVEGVVEPMTSWQCQQETLRRAAAVTVTREPLAKEIRAFCPHVYVLPNFVDITLFDNPGHDRSPVTIGYFGSHTHHRDVEMIAGVVGKVMRQYPDTFLVTIGGYAPTDAALSHGVPKDRFRSIPWIEDRKVLNTGLALMDIGLAPLTQDKFNESKSWIKCLEYGAVGAPTIASDVGPYHDFIQPEWGYLCRTKSDWKDALHELLSNKEKRLEMSHNARKMAEENSIQNNVYRWEAVLKEVIERYHGSQDSLPTGETTIKESVNAYDC